MKTWFPTAQIRRVSACCEIKIKIKIKNEAK